MDVSGVSLTYTFSSTTAEFRVTSAVCSFTDVTFSAVVLVLSYSTATLDTMSCSAVDSIQSNTTASRITVTNSTTVPVFIRQNSNLVMNDSSFTGTHTIGSSGGFYADSSTASFYNATFSGNSGYSSGTVDISSSNGILYIFKLKGNIV